MTTQPVPLNANDFLEAQLHERIRAVADAFKADAIVFNGGLVFGVDDAIRGVIETMRPRSAQEKLVVLLTTAGGYIEVVQRIVETLRHHYKTIDFVIPNYAFSAGTVLAMSGDEIHMNYYSRLGPIDPQVEVQGKGMVPALGYLVQWDRLIEKAQSGVLTTAEVQVMIYHFDQAELYKYEQAREHSVTLLREWLAQYKFKNWTKTATRQRKVTARMRENRAEEIARQLNDPDKWHSHGYGISMGVLRSDLNLLIEDFDATPEKGNRIKEYHSLLADYMVKRGYEGVVHTDGIFLPFM